MLGSTLADNGCGTIPVKMIELHRVVDRQHDCSSDCFTKFNSVAKLSSAYLSNWSLKLFDKLSLENLGMGLKGLAMIFAGLENPFIIFRSKDIYIYFKTNNKIPINLLK